MRRLAFVLILALAACGQLSVKDLEPGETGTVAKVFDGDTLALDTNLEVQLTGIETPRRDAPLAKEARAALERLAQGREARLFYGGEKRLEDGRALAQVYVKTEGGSWVWLQERLLSEGLARAHSWKTNNARAERLLAAEAKARDARQGIWAEPYFAVRTAETVSGAEGGYQIVEGVVRSVETRDDRTYLNFGEDYRSDFTVMILAKDLPTWGEPALDPASLEGASVRVRGFVSDRGGALIRADHAAQIEVLKGT